MQSETNATTFATRNSQFATLLLCYGNPLRRDDGVGWVIGERLAETLPEAVADVRVLHQLTPELAEPISRAGAVIFIDAAESNVAPVGFNPLPLSDAGFNRRAGTIDWRTLEPGNFTAQPFTHQVEPASLLAAAKELFGHAPPAHLLTVTGGDFGYGEGLSPEVAHAVEEVIGQINQFIERRRLEI